MSGYKKGVPATMIGGGGDGWGDWVLLDCADGTVTDQGIETATFTTTAGVTTVTIEAGSGEGIGGNDPSAYPHITWPLDVITASTNDRRVQIMWKWITKPEDNTNVFVPMGLATSATLTSSNNVWGRNDWDTSTKARSGLGGGVGSSISLTRDDTTYLLAEFNIPREGAGAEQRVTMSYYRFFDDDFAPHDRDEEAAHEVQYSSSAAMHIFFAMNTVSVEEVEEVITGKLWYRLYDQPGITAEPS